jgi:REP element-mobilizing transposase RayT
MARPWRIQFPDAIYHITSRGNNRAPIFREDNDRHLFLELLGNAVPRFQLTIFAFCLMTNHYHLFLRTARANLSATLQWLNAGYSRRFHRRHGSSGHLFQNRYHAVLITEESHWHHLSMYLHLNPVRAGLVEDPAGYPWSSFRDYIRPAPRFAWLKPAELLSDYGEGAAARRRYRRECLVWAGTRPDWVESLKTAVILGSQEMVEKIKNDYRPSGKTELVQGYAAARRAEVNVADELSRLAGQLCVKVDELLRKRRNFPPRFAAYYHLVENCGLSVSETAAALGVKPPSVSWGIRKYKEGVRALVEV